MRRPYRTSARTLSAPEWRRQIDFNNLDAARRILNDPNCQEMPLMMDLARRTLDRLDAQRSKQKNLDF